MVNGAQPERTPWWKHAWVAIGGLAVVAGLIASLLSIFGFFSPKTQSSSGGVGTGPTAPSGLAEYAGELSTHAGATAFVAFAQENDGKQVHLELSCVDDFETATCYAEPLDEMILLWVFTNDRCFIEDDENADLDSCAGANVFWIGDRAGSNVSVSNGPSGAGSIEIKGDFGLADQGFGGAIFPVSIRSWDLTPVPL